MGLEQTKAQGVADALISCIDAAQTLEDLEIQARELFTKTRVGDHNFFQIIQLSFSDRVNKIFEQVSPYLKDVSGKVFDYGMGAGGVAQKIQDELGLAVEGGDVRDFRALGVTVPFVLLNHFPNSEGRIVPVQDKYFEACVVTNVIHHEEVNENILKELDRITSRKLVIIETVPVGNSDKEIKLDHERTFASDVLWNRFFNSADIPVPGTYETPEDWIKRFEQFGWKTVHSENLGYDQKSIHDVHYLLVFER